MKGHFILAITLKGTGSSWPLDCSWNQEQTDKPSLNTGFIWIKILVVKKNKLDPLNTLKQGFTL